MLYVIGFAAAAVLMIAEYQLGTKMKSPLAGGIIPAAILIASVAVFATGKVPLKGRYIFPFVVLNTIFFFYWEDCRRKRQKRQQEEIDKMKAHDI